MLFIVFSLIRTDKTNQKLIIDSIWDHSKIIYKYYSNVTTKYYYIILLLHSLYYT